MSDHVRFRWDPLAIRDVLAGFGYDADLSDAWIGGTIRARRERGDRAWLLVLDASGRFRADLAATLDETGRAAEVGGVPARVVAVTERRVTVTGILPSLPDLAPLVAALDDLAARDLPPADESPTGCPPPG